MTIDTKTVVNVLAVVGAIHTYKYLTKKANQSRINHLHVVR